MTALPLSAAEQARLDALRDVAEWLESMASPTLSGDPFIRAADWAARLVREFAALYEAAIDLLRGPSSDGEQAVARVQALADELVTRYPDAPPELQAILRAV